MGAGVLGASNIMEYPTKHRKSFCSKYHLTADGIIPCSAFVFTSLLLQMESPPTDRLQCPRPHLCKQFFGATTAVMTSHPPDRSLSSYPNKPHSEKSCMVVLDTVFLSHHHAHSCWAINSPILLVLQLPFIAVFLCEWPAWGMNVSSRFWKVYYYEREAFEDN